MTVRATVAPEPAQYRPDMMSAGIGEERDGIGSRQEDATVGSTQRGRRRLVSGVLEFDGELGLLELAGGCRRTCGS
jgi:hypothetical protein